MKQTTICNMVKFTMPQTFWIYICQYYLIGLLSFCTTAYQKQSIQKY